MDNFSLDRFKSSVLNGGMARPNRFQAIIISPSATARDDELVSLYCESAQFPQVTLQVKPFKIQGPSYQRPISVEYGGEGLPLTFHLDRDMRVKKYFDDWIHNVVNPGSFTMNYFKEYVKDITLNQLDEQNNITYSLRLVDAFPRMTNIVDLNHSTTNQIHKLTVLFVYRYWETLDINHSNVEGGAGLQAVNFETAPPENKGKNDIQSKPVGGSSVTIPSVATPPFVPGGFSGAGGQFGGGGASGSF